MLRIDFETVRTFLQRVERYQWSEEVSLWTEFLSFDKKDLRKGRQELLGPLEWTFVGERDVIIQHFPIFREMALDRPQTLNKENYPLDILKWVTLHYLPLSSIKEVSIQTPVTLFIDRLLPIESRKLFNDHKIYSIVSKKEMLLPPAFDYIHCYVSPEGTFEQLFQPISTLKETKSSSLEPIKIEFLDHFTTILDEMKQNKAKEEAYWQIVDDIWLDAFNRYWLANNSPLSLWLLDALHSIDELKQTLIPAIQSKDVVALRKRLELWIQNLSKYDQHFRN